MRNSISYGEIWFIGECVVAVVDDGRSPYEFTHKLKRPQNDVSEWSFINFFIPCYENLLSGKPMSADVFSFLMIYLESHISKKLGIPGMETALSSLKLGLEQRLRKGFINNNLTSWIYMFESRIEYMRKSPS